MAGLDVVHCSAGQTCLTNTFQLLFCCGCAGQTRHGCSRVLHRNFMPKSPHVGPPELLQPFRQGLAGRLCGGGAGRAAAVCTPPAPPSHWLAGAAGRRLARDQRRPAGREGEAACPAVTTVLHCSLGCHVLLADPFWTWR